MFNIDPNGTICISRGDNATITLTICYDCEDNTVRRYILVPGDEVYFSVSISPKECPSTGDWRYDKNYIFYKRLTSENLDSNNDIIISIDSADTINMEQGVYFYTVKAKCENEISSIVGKTRFIIL